MAAYLYDRLVTEDEYRQRVRRYRPSSLLPLIAAAAARYGAPERPQPWLKSPAMKYTPWTLADTARVCLAYGTEYQRSEATERDLLEILAAYSSLQEPTLHGTDEPTVRLRDFTGNDGRGSSPPGFGPGAASAGRAVARARTNSLTKPTDLDRTDRSTPRRGLSRPALQPSIRGAGGRLSFIGCRVGRHGPRATVPSWT
ncbi:hypothetical protein ACFY0P_43765 [Streptomyces sp. NPDC001714]|uniref:hypothetical protein n=1 Tax=Streptomyces sp. NPDC001714 TaxID=3364603 RepID=UPI0036A8D342